MAGEQSAPDDHFDEQVEKRGRFRAIAWIRLFASVLMGLVIGGLLAWMSLNIGGSEVLFIVGLVGSTWYLYRKPSTWLTIGTGLYISAGLLVLTPILFYIPVMFGAGEGLEGAGEFFGSLIGLVVWAFVFFLIALVIFALGYFVNKKGRQKVSTQEESPQSS
ncbi:hypothetical protein [Natronobeatus ordinarius]|uniref:hypothetical protein n=1 Tax=Natronobeatus ordinarius TaxID=2963433 RepID=UPI0020CE40C5|nr:hypothetical protein [Natronobeatus ordinarius]